MSFATRVVSVDKDLDARQEFVGEAGENESERDGPRELTNKVKLQVITTKYLSTIY